MFVDELYVCVSGNLYSTLKVTNLCLWDMCMWGASLDTPRSALKFRAQLTDVSISYGYQMSAYGLLDCL